MFQIKICGITTPEDCWAAVEAGADAIGLNFYRASPRYLTPLQAREIVLSIKQPTEGVGVFVDTAPEESVVIAKEVGLTWIQLHGDQRPEMLVQLNYDVPIIRVRSLDRRGLDAVVEDVEACQQAGRAPSAVLIDAQSPGAYGGTGKTVCWDALVGHEARLGDLPLILAGGLRPGNIGAAIGKVGPAAVDTASGVESRPGCKDHEKMRSFVHAARAAWNGRMQE
jgi:phosphoribosylanthranilate isomerase